MADAAFGRAFALALAQAGAHVIVTARSELEIQDTVHSIEQQGGSASAFPADVTDRTAVQRVITSVEQQHGSVDLLVNNAGAFRAFGLVADIDPDEWWREVEINVRGPFLYVHAVLPGMIARRRGRIINVASGAGLQPFETISAYNVSKTALIRLTESIALEIKAHDIAIFAIHPGTVRTPMNDYVLTSPDIQQHAPLVYQWFQQLYKENRDTPIERAVDLVLLLASGAADPLSGCYLSVTDDVDAMIQQADEIQQEHRLRLRLRT